MERLKISDNQVQNAASGQKLAPHQNSSLNSYVKDGKISNARFSSNNNAKKADQSSESEFAPGSVAISDEIEEENEREEDDDNDGQEEEEGEEEEDDEELK